MRIYLSEARIVFLSFELLYLMANVGRYTKLKLLKSFFSVQLQLKRKYKIQNTFNNC